MIRLFTDSLRNNPLRISTEVSLMNNFSFQVYPTKGVDNLSKMSAESTIIDMLYNKRGKPYKANKTRKEQLLMKSSQIIVDLEKSMKIQAKNDDDW